MNFHSTQNETITDRLHPWLVKTKFNMGTLDLDNHHQSFWQLIDRSILSCSTPGLAESNSRLAV